MIFRSQKPVTDRATIDIVNSKYLAIKGTDIDVSGMIWATKNRKTVWPSKMEIDNVIFSPESTGK